MDKSMANEERLVGEVSGRLQFFRFADAPMIKRVGIVLLMVPFLTGLGPWERTPGGKLLGQVHTEQVGDWSFVSDAKRCAVETRPQFPHSVTVNCWSLGGQLYIGCMNCEGKTWSRYLLEEPNVRVRVLGYDLSSGVYSRQRPRRNARGLASKVDSHAASGACARGAGSLLSFQC